MFAHDPLSQVMLYTADLRYVNNAYYVLVYTPPVAAL